MGASDPGKHYGRPRWARPGLFAGPAGRARRRNCAAQILGRQHPVAACDRTISILTSENWTPQNGRRPMHKIKLMVILLAFLCSLPLVPAQAQPLRAFVSAHGVDTNPCSFAAPCRTFQHAHDILASGGEIDVLDPAGYGPLNISKSISIQGHGYAGLSVASGNAITITAAGINVNVRGLLMDGVGTGAIGISDSFGAKINIEDSLIRNFTTRGIDIFPPIA